MAVTVTRQGNVAVVGIDWPPVNALSQKVRQGLVDAFAALVEDDAVKGVVISGGAGKFIAGADISEMNLPPNEPILPDVVVAIENCPKPVVAAIDGATLGGGLEIALACDHRIANPKAVLGLTETRLGIIPGAGGTQRLPRIVGVDKAIELICGGKILKAQAALELGLVDGLSETVLADAVAAAGTVRKNKVSERAVPVADADAVAVAKKVALKAARGVPAIAEAIGVIEAAADGSFAEGMKRERETFLALRESSEAAALRHLFFAEREAAKVEGLDGVAPRAFARTAVIGAGTMGAGIAVALADAELEVKLIERDAEAAKAGAERVGGIYQKLVERGRLSAAEKDARLGRIEATADWEVLRGVDLVIEAAFEDLDVKIDIFKRLDALLPQGAVLASNTSYLDLNAIAEATGRPQDVLGLHFFSPANVMRLLEIVRADKTAPDVLATGLALAKKIGKQPVVARVCDGFIGNRIYAVYRREAEYLVEDGAAPEEIDAALEAFGFAMGLFAVSDMSGLDIAYSMRKRRAATRDPDERYVDIADRLVESGRLGRKSGAGWYRYDESGAKHVDPEVAALIEGERVRKGITPRTFTAEEIQTRLIGAMAEEGAKILAEGIAQRASDIDVAFVNGYGFPRVKGGPMWFAAQQGDKR